MGQNFYFWLDIIVALFMGLLMIIDFRRYKLNIFLLMFSIYLFVFIKSGIYLLIGFTDVKFIEQILNNSISRILDPSLQPLYDFKYFIFQYVETIFTLSIMYAFIFARRNAEEMNNKGVKTSMVLQYLVASLFAGVVIFLSVSNGNKETFQTAIPFVEFVKSNIFGKLIFVAWRLILLVVTWIVIASVYGYVATLLKVISRYKKRLFMFIMVEMFFTLMSLFINFYTNPVWFLIHDISLLILTVFAFANHSGYIESIQDRVVNLNKEKDMIITLMKEISNIVGSGDIELDTIIRKIVEDSVKGTASRGGAALLKDPITNRLIVKHVSGLYPPTKPFKSTQGLTLTESIIVGKFQSERIAMGEGFLGKVAQTGEAVYIPDVSKDDSYVQTLLEYIKVQSFIAVPLKTKDDVFGVLTVIDDAKLLQENDLSLLETLGEQAAITIKQIQMYQQVLEKKQAEKEISVAAEIQSSLIPHTFPTAERFDIYGFSIPAKGVGGDYYDYIEFGNNKIALTMFDVSGKGVPASLIMVMIRSILRTIASLNQETKDVLIKLNDTIAGEIVEDRYATGFYLLFDAEKGIMSYTNAGHGPLMLYRADADDFEFLDTDGMPIGIMSGVEYGQNYTIIAKNDIAILYTDGITEAMNVTHEEFGMDRFKEVIRKYKRESAREIANKILEAITSFSGAAPQHDDETLLVMKSK